MFTFIRHGQVLHTTEYEKLRRISELPSDIEIGRITGSYQRILASRSHTIASIIKSRDKRLPALSDDEKQLVQAQYEQAVQRSLEAEPWLSILLDTEIAIYHPNPKHPNSSEAITGESEPRSHKPIDKWLRKARQLRADIEQLPDAIPGYPHENISGELNAELQRMEREATGVVPTVTALNADMYRVPAKLSNYMNISIADAIDSDRIGSLLGSRINAGVSNGSISLPDLRRCLTLLKAMKSGLRVPLNTTTSDQLELVIQDLDESRFSTQSYIDDKPGKASLVPRLNSIVRLTTLMGATADDIGCKPYVKNLLTELHRLSRIKLSEFENTVFYDKATARKTARHIFCARLCLLHFMLTGRRNSYTTNSLKGDGRKISGSLVEFIRRMFQRCDIKPSEEILRSSINHANKILDSLTLDDEMVNPDMWEYTFHRLGQELMDRISLGMQEGKSQDFDLQLT